jgi:hypothetical protein
MTNAFRPSFSSSLPPSTRRRRLRRRHRPSLKTIKETRGAMAMADNNNSEDYVVDDDDTCDKDENKMKMTTASAMMAMILSGGITTATIASAAGLAHASTYDYRDENYMENIANSVSSSEGETRKPTLKSKVKGENGKKIERCAGQCITTCVRGSFNSTSGPGLGPLTRVQEPFVFKDGFRSRQYCVEECLDYCALTVNKKGAVPTAAPPIALK